MADCSKTDIFLGEWQRMCDTVKICMRCDIPVDSITGASCIQFVRKNRETAIRIVQKWSDEHPLPKPKTYLDVLFDRNPESSYPREEMMRRLCRTKHFGESGCPADEGDVVSCVECWNEPYPEQEASNE